MKIPLPFLASLWVLSWMSCAHLGASAALETVRREADDFHYRVRWKDFEGASVVLAPELRERFLKARVTLKDEDNLAISDYELEKIELSSGQDEVLVFSRMMWVRMPQVRAHQARLTSRFQRCDRGWCLVRQEGGPFSELAFAR